MTARSVYESVAATTHTATEFGGVSSVPGAPSLPGNATLHSRANYRAFLASGQWTQAQYISAMNAIAGYEQAQINNARDVLKNSGDNAPA